MKRFSVVVALLLALAGARAEGPDDQYIHIYNLIQEADKLADGGQISEALPKYIQAQSALERFQKGYPDWNPKVVTFRLGYVSDKVAKLSARAPAPATNAPAGTATKAAPSGTSPPQAAKPAPGDWESQIAALSGQVRQLQADKAVLEAKLKEALSVQPAAVDPRELAKAEEQAKSLQKENDLLKVSLDQQKAKPATAADSKALEEARVALEEANRKLAEQAKAAGALAKEKADLQARLNSVAASPATAAELAAARKALQETNAKLADQTKLASGLAEEKQTLQARLKSLTADVDAAVALRRENQLLKKQVAELSAAPPSTGKAEEASRKLAQMQAQLAALQSEKEMLRLEKAALEGRVKQLMAAASVAAPVASPKAAENGRIKLLERERDDLQKQLAAANKERFSRKNKAAAARVAELELQLTALRARLDVYEARQVPYTAEELALFKPPATKLAPEAKASKAPASELPPGTVSLVAEARRYYANRQLDQAEAKYLEVLKQSNTNVLTLANLAAIELDRNHYDAAEINIKQAVALAPEDPYALFVLGRLRFCQKRYDDAVDALGRAARIDPEDAQIQNFLGLALSEKGMRGPAEAALRKAIQLDPGYANAHNNLAVAYITQQPPLVELARWHYQKALAAGQPRNPELEKLLEAAKSAAAK